MLGRATYKLSLRMVRFVDTLEGIRSNQLEGFFVGWPRRPSADRHLEILRGSAHVWLAMDGERCIGFINAVSDGCFSAFIPMLEVLPEHQGKGIGKELVRRMISTCERYYSVDLVCDPDWESFYRPLGFRVLSGMAVRNVQNIS